MKVLRAYWRDASLTPRLLAIDARAFFPFLIALYHPRTWTFIAAFVVVIGFLVMEKRGYTLPVLMRAVRHKLRGTVVHSRAWWHHRRHYE